MRGKAVARRVGCVTDSEMSHLTLRLRDEMSGRRYLKNGVLTRLYGERMPMDTTVARHAHARQTTCVEHELSVLRVDAS